MKEKKVLLSVKDLCMKLRVRGRILTAIRGITLDIYEDESIAIVGESGSGKSVFTVIFAGMLDSNGFIDRGEILFNDPELADTRVMLTPGAQANAGHAHPIERAFEAGTGRAELPQNGRAGIRAQAPPGPLRRGAQGHRGARRRRH